MDLDARRKRAQYIDKTSEIRETFHFAHPNQILKAAQVYASDAYGFMLYDFSSQTSQSFFNSWNTFVKLAWNVPRNTFTYIVENVLGASFVSLRKQIFSRYITFFRNLFTSTSMEVRHLARIIARDAKSTVNKNVRLIQQVSGLSPWDHSKVKIMENIQNAAVPPNNDWRLSLIVKFLDFRRKKENLLEDTKVVTEMIDSLCNT